MSHNGTIFPPQSVRRLGQKIIKWEDILYIYFTKCAKKIDQYSIKSCCLQMPIWREVREVSSHVTCHATLVSFQPKERSCAEAEAKKEVHSLLSLGGINAQKVGHLASEIGVGIPKKSNEIFCGSSKRLGSGAGKMLLLRLKPFFLLFFALSLFGGSKSSQPQRVAAFSRLFRAQKLLSAFASAYLNCKRGRSFFLCETWPDCYSFQPTMTSGSKINSSSLKTTPPSETFPKLFGCFHARAKSIFGMKLILQCRIAGFTSSNIVLKNF